MSHYIKTRTTCIFFKKNLGSVKSIVLILEGINQGWKISYIM